LIRLELLKKNSGVIYFFTSINLNRLSTDLVTSNNQVNLIARLKVRANLFLYGYLLIHGCLMTIRFIYNLIKRTKTPEQLFYGDGSVIKGESAMKSLEEIGPIIEHTYKVN